LDSPKNLAYELATDIVVATWSDMIKPQEIRFPLPDDNYLDKIVSSIQEDSSFLEEPVTNVTHTFLDSFDWRLYAAGISLWMEKRDGSKTLRQNGIPNLYPGMRVEMSGAVPRFSRDLPQGAIKDAVSKLLDIRCLLPHVDIKSRVRSLRILDTAEKTVLRIEIEQNSSRLPGTGKYDFCGYNIKLLPVRGYIKPFVRIQKLLQDEFGLIAAEDSFMDESLRSVGKKAGDYSSKLNFSFGPDMPASMAAKQIHLYLLNIMEVNIPGVKADLDSEFLHDLRVAVRRTRSALTQIKGVFSDADLEFFKQRMAWVGQVTGPTRDMDVFLLGFDQYRDSLPDRFRVDLDPMHDFLDNHQKMEHQILVKKINSPHFRKLCKEWREFLEAAPDEQVEMPLNANMPIARLANKRIYKMFQRVMRAGGAINDESPAESLHDLRKDCKKLRYLMEFFQHLYPNKKINHLIKSLKVLLGNLGDFQDLEVQADKLRDFARQMVEEGDTPHTTLLAMGMLVDGLLRRQHKTRLKFSERFSVFSSAENKLAFQNLFAPEAKKGVV